MAAAEAADPPITPPEAAELLQPLSLYRHVALAISGGGDSMALMWLARRWASEAHEAPRLTVLTVDHGLREGSAEEASFVVRQARQLGLEAVMLDWRGEKPATGVQAEAREARYDLLIQWCLDHAAEALATAHNLEDQAETFVMRLARGSGIDGLSAMRPLRDGKVAILRPLLGVTRDRLRGTLASAGIGWIEDPSNQDRRFERVRWRKTLEYLGEEGLRPAMIALSARRIERARQALEHATSRLEAQAVTHEAETATFPRVAVQGEPEELQVRLLRRLILRYGSGGEAPELSALERLNVWLSAGESGGRTLAGCRVTRRRGWVRFSREPPRRHS